MRKRPKNYSDIVPDPGQTDRIEGERKRITSRVNIDYSVFQKTANEKQRLKDAKRGIVTKKKCRPGKEQRRRDAIKK